MGATLLAAVCVLSLTHGQVDTRHPNFVKQIETIDRMVRLSSYIELYREDHKKDPPSLRVVAGAFGLPRDQLVDGWGRAFYYYTTGGSYVLVSFGRSGAPKQQVAEPGGVMQRQDFDTNMVLIDGKWAQTPLDVDR